MFCMVLLLRGYERGMRVWERTHPILILRNALVYGSPQGIVKIAEYGGRCSKEYDIIRKV